MGKHQSANGTLASNRPRMDRFLDKLRESGNVRQACEASGVPRRTVYTWRQKWQTFADGWQDALDDACDELESVAWERAKDGNDRMIMFLLKAHRPEKYKDRQHVELDGDAVSVNVYMPDNGRSRT